ncbi:MAG: fructose 1,6-bisphosphatase [Anaerolineales bacterium]|nr:fructose 1,6-bisphosphatase [Anaerolineales bacterium]
MAKEVTISVIKADVGGLAGHSGIHPDLVDIAQTSLAEAVQEGVLVDYHIAWVGDDLQLIMTHTRGVDNVEVHQVAWNTFTKAADRASELKLCGVGQDFLSTDFQGSIRGMGPSLAEMSFEERKNETVVIWMADKTSPGGWNFPLYKAFADPFNTIGLVIKPNLHEGFRFEVLDIRQNRHIWLTCPEDLYDLLALIGTAGRFVVRSVWTRRGELVAISSTDLLNLERGQHVGKEDPVCILRAQSQFPALGELMEPFAAPHLVEGWERGAHFGPLMPVAQRESNPSRNDGPPRVVALGFQLAEGRLVGPRDLFDDPAYDEARAECNRVANYLRRLGPFEPGRLPLDAMTYTTLPLVMDAMEDRWETFES